jgi:alpha-tubulin suppressor-like RCC1 family protein
VAVTVKTVRGTNIAAGRHHSCALINDGAVICWGDNTSGQLGLATINTSITVVPSLTLNIDPTVAVKSNARVAEVTVIAICDEGSTLHFDLTLSQGSVSGSGHGSGKCIGRLERYAVNVPAHGADRFSDGAAEVSADAVIRDGHDEESQAWTRAVNVTIAP